jgi:transposase InsO family protein
MPWEASTVLDQRLAFIDDCREPELSMAELCRAYNISRTTGYKWLRRSRAEGEAGLRDRSRAPHHQPQRLPDPLAQEIVALRTAHPTWGPRKLRAWLDRQAPGEPWPAPSTIGELLRHRGLSVPRRRGRRLGAALALPLTAGNGPNEVWTLDYKGHFALGDGTRCHPLTIQDASSRLLLRCAALAREDFASAQPVLVAAFREFGLPEVLRSDNGSPFAGTGLTGLTRLSAWWLRLGLHVERIAPAHPEQNGRHERMHGTLKAEATRPAQWDLAAQQRAFERFRHEYNHERPHEALGQAVPADYYQRSPREYPARLPVVEYPADWAVRQVRNKGHMRWRSELLFVSEALIGEPVGLAPLDERLWALYYNRMPLAILDDATRTWLAAKAAAPHLRELLTGGELCEH